METSEAGSSEWTGVTWEKRKERENFGGESGQTTAVIRKRFAIHCVYVLVVQESGSSERKKKSERKA